jgi:hypothetical protein
VSYKFQKDGHVSHKIQKVQGYFTLVGIGCACFTYVSNERRVIETSVI